MLPPDSCKYLVQAVRIIDARLQERRRELRPGFRDIFKPGPLPGFTGGQSSGTEPMQIRSVWGPLRQKRGLMAYVSVAAVNNIFFVIVLFKTVPPFSNQGGQELVSGHPGSH